MRRVVSRKSIRPPANSSMIFSALRCSSLVRAADRCQSVIVDGDNRVDLIDDEKCRSGQAYKPRQTRE